METKITVKIEAATDSLRFGYWLMDDTGENGKFVPLDNMNEEETEVVARLLGISPLCVDALNMLVEDIKERVSGDLGDIWARLDRAGIK